MSTAVITIPRPGRIHWKFLIGGRRGRHGRSAQALDFYWHAHRRPEHRHIPAWYWELGVSRRQINTWALGRFYAEWPALNHLPW